jgi:hypothetical protein
MILRVWVRVIPPQGLPSASSSPLNISVEKYWQVNHGVISLGHRTSTDCYFIPESNYGSVTMVQEIDVKRYIDKVHETDEVNLLTIYFEFKKSQKKYRSYMINYFFLYLDNTNR